jgi:hypothetical protein
MFNPDFPAIKNFRPKVGIASTITTESLLSAAISAAIKPAGPPPIIQISYIIKKLLE